MSRALSLSMMSTVVSCFIAACGVAQQPAPQSGAPAITDDFPLQHPSVIAEDFLWHQEITATVDGKSTAFQVFLGKEGDTLTVIGLSPVGSSWFELVQKGLDVEFWSLVPYALPLPPRYVLADIQRCYFPVSDDPAPREGTRSVMLGRTEVVEVWRAGELNERQFRRVDEEATAAVTVRYQPVSAGGPVERLVVVENPRFGYVLKISTIEQTPRSGTRNNEAATTD